MESASRKARPVAERAAGGTAAREGGLSALCISSEVMIRVCQQ